VKVIDTEEIRYGVLTEEFIASIYEQTGKSIIGLCEADRRKECETDQKCRMEIDCIPILADMAEEMGDTKEDITRRKTKQALEGFKCCCKITLKHRLTIIHEGSCTPEEFRKFGRKVALDNEN